MATLIQRLIRKQSPATIITNLNKRILTPSSSSSIPTHLYDSKPDPSATPIPFFFFNGSTKATEESNPSCSLKFYPSFSFEGFLNPISDTGFLQSVDPDQGIVVTSDDHTIWADSVKKKRKKKMNKHKLKKLRKRLRRKT